MKLSEKLRCLDEYFEHPKDKVVEKCIMFAEAYEAEQEKRIAELELDVALMKDNLELSRKVIDDLKAHNAALQKRIAELEQELKELRGDKAELVDEVTDLQSQLAWTLVSAGLPTEPGYYLFEHPDPGVTLYELVASELYPWRNIGGARRKPVDMARLYERFRRIELPEAT